MNNTTVLAAPKTCLPETLSEGCAKKLAEMGVGTCIFVIQLPHGPTVSAAAARKVVVVWRGQKFLNIMVRKQDAESLLFTVRRLLGKETRPRQKHQDAAEAAAEAAAAAAPAAPAATADTATDLGGAAPMAVDE